MNKKKGKYFNPQRTIHNPQRENGFTLIELLIGIALIGIIGAISTQIFVIGFKSQWKSEIIKEVKQNGDYALSVIERMVRNAADISSAQVCNQDANTLSIVNPDGYTTIFNCDPANYNISSASGTVPLLTGVPLISNKVAVLTSSCRFRVVCPTPPLSPKYVFVSFTLTQAAVTGQPTPQLENTASVEYQGTFSLGNYK